MTIILSCLTPEYIVQVSDRRISIPQLRYRNGQFVREYVPRDDKTNKAILWNNIIALSYTGLGVVSGIPTDTWITKTLAKYATFQEGLEGLRKDITQYFQMYEPYHPTQGFLAIIGIDWSHPSSELKGGPFLFLISNYHDNLQATGFRKKEFNICSGSFNEGHNVILFVAGQPLFRKEYYDLKRYIRAALKRNANPQVITDLFAKTIRDVADRNNTVGKNLMVVSLPRQKPNLITLPGGEQGVFIPFGPPSHKHLSFYYLSEECETIEFGPNIVSPGNYATDYRHEFVGDEERISIRPGFTSLDED